MICHWKHRCRCQWITVTETERRAPPCLLILKSQIPHLCSSWKVHTQGGIGWKMRSYRRLFFCSEFVQNPKGEQMILQSVSCRNIVCSNCRKGTVIFASLPEYMNTCLNEFSYPYLFIVTPRNRSFIFGRGKRFFCFPKPPDRIWVPPSEYRMCVSPR